MAHAVSIVGTSPTPTAVIREATTWERYPTLWGELLDEVWGYVRGAPSREGIAAAHAAVVEWCRANGHELTGTRWEVYDHWRDDPDRFETAVYWLLAS